MNQKNITPIGIIRTDFKQKFGIPRQSGRSPSSTGTIVFCKEFSHPDGFRQIEQFTHFWLIFGFNKTPQKDFCPLVRPPRLGGNKKVGVFASRSPFRPNGLGLSCVKFESFYMGDDGQAYLKVSGVDLLDGTPIYDIKPYIPSADCKPNAVGGFSEEFTDYKLKIDCKSHLLELIPPDKRNALLECLADDPRPSYHADGKEYGMAFAGKNIRFLVVGDTLTVIDIE